MIWGATSDEGMFFVIEITPDPIPNQQTFELILRLIFPVEVVGEIIDHYDYKVDFILLFTLELEFSFMPEYLLPVI